MKLIFIHGSGNTGAVWQYQVQHFPEAEAVDLPGHLSPGKPCTSIEDYAAWLHRHIVEQGYTAPVLAGHSLGGGIALMYALQHPRDTRALILIGTGAKLRVAPQYLSAMQEGIENPSAWAQDFVAPNYSHLDPELRETLTAKTIQVGAEVQLKRRYRYYSSRGRRFCGCAYRFHSCTRRRNAPKPLPSEPRQRCDRQPR